MRTDILTLVKQVRSVDEYGDPTVAETERTVFCEAASVGMKEFYQAYAVGLQPELKFILSDYLDYEGELYAIHDNIRYKIIRTFRTGQALEIIVSREVNPG